MVWSASRKSSAFFGAVVALVFAAGVGGRRRGGGGRGAGGLAAGGGRRLTADPGPRIVSRLAQFRSLVGVSRVQKVFFGLCGNFLGGCWGRVVIVCRAAGIGNSRQGRGNVVLPNLGA